MICIIRTDIPRGRGEGGSRCLATRGLLKREKKSVPERQFCKKTVCSSYVQPWLVEIGRGGLATGGWWRLVAVGGGWRRLVVGDFCLVAVGSGWRLAVVRRLRLVAVGPLGRSLRAVLNKYIYIYILLHPSPLKFS